jgi:hypothetical protein
MLEEFRPTVLANQIKVTRGLGSQTPRPRRAA